MIEALQAIPAEVACPKDSAVACPARVQLVNLYRPEDLASDALNYGELSDGDPNHPRFDEGKLQVKLFEHKAQAIGRGCVGPEGELCPVRTAMSESRVREGLVNTIRVFLRSFRDR